MLVFRALASGSSGNAYLLRTDGCTILLEAGLNLVKLRKALTVEGVAPQDLTAVIVSHEHTDHCQGARLLAEHYGTPVWANSDVLRAAGLWGLPQAAVLDVGRTVVIGDVEVTTFPVPHDAVSPVGFFLRVDGKAITIATDLGGGTGEVAEALSAADLVVLEANHDMEMLQNSRYPYPLRRRISGPNGHLSNTQAASLLGKHMRGDDVEVWLAHLSRNNNTPSVALKTVQRALKALGLGSVQVAAASRDRPSLRWTGSLRPRQLALFGAEAE